MTKRINLLAIFILVIFPSLAYAKKPVMLINVSYDPTREVFQEINAEFSKDWRTKHNQKIVIKQSHGGSGKQARAVISGLLADVVTLALSYDIDMIAEKGLLSKDWQNRLPNNSSPYGSTIIFLVRKGNPKKIYGWDDLVKEGVKIITPNPKTSGGAKWNYLAAWSFAMKKFANDEKLAEEFISKLYHNVPVLDTGARSATITFAQREIGDVLLTWENEAHLALNQLGSDKLEIIVPKESIKIDLPVALVDKTVKRKNTELLATAYLEFLYSDFAQQKFAKYHFRPYNQEFTKHYNIQFPQIEFLPVNESWQSIQAKHFAEGAIFDKIYGGSL